jgi:hypothetical protein
MKILFTNNGLRARAGTELYVRDVALAMLRAGHRAAAYSPTLGPVADEMQAHGVVVVDDLDGLPWVPEVIHGHHHLETMTALIYFGAVPAVYVCHGVAPWQEAPPRHPRLLHYAAVSDLVRDTAVRRHGVPRERTGLLLGFVDVERFRPRPALPSRPGRALLFSNHASPEFIYPEILAGCRLCGVELDAVGSHMGNATDRPEDLLGRYDLVFAVGRSALEAMACGTAVIACGITGLGPLVDSSRFDRLRSLNFGIGCTTTELTAEAVADQIRHYDAEDAARVAGRVRREAGLDGAARDLVELYTRAIAEFRETPGLAGSPDPAAAVYLAGLGETLKRLQRGRGRRQQEGADAGPAVGPASRVPPGLRRLKSASEEIVGTWRNQTGG